MELSAELRVALGGEQLPDAENYPVGTRYAIRDTDGQRVYRLHDDGKWRPFT